jgi:hypothetical protein
MGLYSDFGFFSMLNNKLTNNYTNRSGNIFKSSDPPKADELKEVITMYTPDAGISGTAGVMRANNLVGQKSPAQLWNIVILLALLIQILINNGTYTNILQYLNTALASSSNTAQPAVAPMEATNDDLLVVLFKMAQLKYSSGWNSKPLFQLIDLPEILPTPPNKYTDAQLNNVKNKLQDDFFVDAPDGPIFKSFKTAFLQYKKNGKLKAGWFWGGRRTRKGKSKSKGHKVKGKNYTHNNRRRRH